MKGLISILLILLVSISFVSAGRLNSADSATVKTNEEPQTNSTFSFLRSPTFQDLTVKGKLLVEGSALINEIVSKDLFLRTKGDLVIFSDAIVLKDVTEDNKLTIQKDFDTEKRWLIQSGWLKLLGHDGLVLESGSGSVTVKSLLKLAKGLNVADGESIFEGPVITQSTLDAWNGFSVSKGLSTFVDKVTILGPLNVMNDAKFNNIYSDGQISAKRLKVDTVISDLITEGWIKGKKVIATDGAEIDDVIVEGKSITTREGSTSGLFLTSDAHKVSIEGDLIVETLGSSGSNAFVCVNQYGVLFRSETPCA